MELFSVNVTKIDEAQRVVYGWASVIEKNGEPVVDRQGHVIRESTLVKAVHQFIGDVRAGKVMHAGARRADIVESIVFTNDLQKALGIDLKQSGWFIGMKLRDDELWKQVQAGDYPAFSIGGHGVETELNAGS